MAGLGAHACLARVHSKGVAHFSINHRSNLCGVMKEWFTSLSIAGLVYAYVWSNDDVHNCMASLSSSASSTTAKKGDIADNLDEVLLVVTVFG